MNRQSEPAQLTFWGSGTARTIRPIWVAEELCIEYRLIPIGPRTGETRTAEYTELNPKQKSCRQVWKCRNHSVPGLY